MEDKIQAGEREAVKASEEVTRRNVEMIRDFSLETRKMVLELRVMFDALQANVMNMNSLLEETRRQLALLQQQSCAKGTVTYN